MMSLASLNIGTGVTPPAVAPLTEKTGSSSSGVPFASILSGYVQEIDQHQHLVAKDAHALATGQMDNVHQVAINVAQADLSFRLAMEVRDKLLSAYQEVMRMQV